MMYGHWATRTVALSATVLLALSGCMSGDNDDGQAAKPPAGGWPQPENGKLTDKMCGLLTPADYKQLGHNELLPLAPESGIKESSNYLRCGASLNTLVLVLQPTAEAAKVWHDASLAGRKKTVVGNKLQTVLAEDIVPNTDGSWFDYWANGPGTEPVNDYELRVRRGALVAELVFGGVDASKEKDPKGSLVKLATLLLERIPEVGKTDTGTTPKVRFEATGTGVASIRYSATGHDSKTLEKVPLPWNVELPVADHGATPMPFDLSVNGPTGGLPIRVGCGITLNGKVIKQQQGMGLAQCGGMYVVQ